MRSATVLSICIYKEVVRLKVLQQCFLNQENKLLQKLLTDQKKMIWIYTVCSIVRPDYISTN